VRSPKFPFFSNPILAWRSLTRIPSGGVALVLVLIFFGVWRTSNRLLAGIEAFINAPPATPQVEVSSLILNRIRSVNELATAVFVMEAVVPTSQDNKLGNLTLGTTKLLYIAHGEVRAGIDLSKLTSDAIAIQGQTIRVQLPPPQILDSKIDVNRSRVYDYNRGFLNLGPDVAPQLQTLAQQQTLQTLVSNACQGGILEQASDRAQFALTQLLSTAGYRQIEILPTAASQCLPPDLPQSKN